VCQPQEIERLRLALATLCSTLGSVSAELKEAGLFRVQAQRELCEAFLEIDQETLRILPVLESNDCVVGIPTTIISPVAWRVRHCSSQPP
jgi:hypothetical protein